MTQDELKELLDYNPETGVFIVKKATANRVKIGQIAGSVDPRGYQRIMLRGKRYWAHRLAFLFMTGSFPAGLVDHINRNKGDNSWNNLREADKSENAFNTEGHKDSRTGVKGVSLSGTKFRAFTYVTGKQVHLGSFASLSAAAEVSRIARIKHHKSFTNA